MGHMGLKAWDTPMSLTVPWPRLKASISHLDGLHGAHDHHCLRHAGAQTTQQPSPAVEPTLSIPHLVAEELERPEPKEEGV